MRVVRFDLKQKSLAALGAIPLGALLEVVASEFLLEAVDAAHQVNRTIVTARIERVARRTNFNLEFGLGAERLPRRAATTANRAFLIVWMDAFFHV